MGNIHIIIQRWFASGEGWAYDAEFPETLRNQAPQCIADALRFYQGKIYETQCDLNRCWTLYIHIEPDAESMDRTAQNRHPHFDIGILAPSRTSLTSEERKGIIESAKKISKAGSYDIKQICPDTAPSSFSGCGCRVFLSLFLILAFLSTFWLLHIRGKNPSVEQLSQELSQKLAQYPNLEEDSTDYTESQKRAKKRLIVYENFLNEYSVNNPLIEEWEAKKKEEVKIIEDLEKYLPLQDSKSEIDRSADKDKLGLIEKFLSEYTLEKYPKAKSVIDKMKQKKGELLESFDEKICTEIEDCKDDESLTFSERTENAKRRQEIYKKYAEYYPEDDPKHRELRDNAKKEKSFEDDNGKHIEKEKSDQSIENTSGEEQSAEFTVSLNEKDIPTRLIPSETHENPSITSEPKEKSVDWSSKNDFTNWKLAIVTQGDIYNSNYKLEKFIEINNEAATLGEKSKENPNNPELRFLAYFKRIDPFPDVNNVTEKEYNDKIAAICELYEVDSFSKLEDKLNFQKFFEKCECNCVVVPVDSKVCQLVQGFCIKESSPEYIQTLFDFMKGNNLLNNEKIQKEDCFLRPAFLVWSFFQKIRWPITPKDAVEMQNEKKMEEYFCQSFNGKVAFKGTDFKSILEEFYRVQEVFQRIKQSGKEQ